MVTDRRRVARRSGYRLPTAPPRSREEAEGQVASAGDQGVFAAPGVGAPQSAQSVAASFVSLPFGMRQTEATTALLSATAFGSTVPSTRLIETPPMVARTPVARPAKSF